MRKLPVFYHVPKCAGTYVCDWLLLGFRYYRRTRADWSEKYIPHKENIKLLQIKKGKSIIAKLLVGDPDYLIDDSPELKRLRNPEYLVSLNSQALKKVLQDCFLFAVIVESEGFRIKNKILKLLNNYKLHQFLVLREPFEREQSTFNYLTSHSSQHEPTHAAIKQSSLEDYFLSEQLPDSWIIKNLLNLDDTEQLTERHFKKTLKLLNDNFHVYTIDFTDNAIQEALDYCYGIDIKDVSFKIPTVIEKNKSTRKKIDFSILSKKAQSNFKKRTNWDQKLYKHYNTKYDRPR